MKAICKMSHQATTWPCSAGACPLFDDCLVEYQAKESIRQRLGKAINDFCARTGHYPVILAESEAFNILVSDHDAWRDPNDEWRWGHGTPLRRIASGGRGIYLVEKLEPVLVLPPKEVQK